LGALGVLVLSLATPACRSGEAPKPKQQVGVDSGPIALATCSLGIRLSGEVQAIVSPKQEVTCVAVDSFVTGIDVVYVSPGPVSSIALRISDVAEGKTGGPFLAGASIVLEDGRRFETSRSGCRVGIEEHRPRGTQKDSAGRKTYQVAGRGTCSAALPEAGAASIAIADLTFRMPVVWRD
jgi:hypothetical protein